MKTLLCVLFSLFFIGSSMAGEPKHCKGTTKAGAPCKSIMVMKSGYCRQHDPAAFKCGAPTKKGTCGMVVSKPGEKCRFHKS